MLKTAAICVLMAFAGVGCASVGTDYSEVAVAQLQPGMSKAEVVSRLGQPNSQSTLPDGRQLLMWLHSEANMLSGKSAARSVSIFFDASGHMTRQVNNTQTDTRF